MELKTKRNGKIVKTGNTLGVSLRQEILDCGLDYNDKVSIKVVVDRDENKQIIIEAKDGNESTQPDE